MIPTFYFNQVMFDSLIYNETTREFYKEQEESTEFVISMLVQLFRLVLVLSLLYMIFLPTRIEIHIHTLQNFRIVRIEHRKLLILQLLASGVTVGAYWFRMSLFNSDLEVILRIIISILRLL